MNPIQYILIFLIKVYQWVLSPLKNALFGVAGHCRFSPSCSAYALEAIKSHGALRGTWLALKRLCRCHPWGDFGPDPVPPVHHRHGSPTSGSRDRSRCAVQPALLAVRHPYH